MFGFFKWNPQAPSDADYRGEYKRLTDRMWAQYEVDATPHDELLHAMAVLENEVIEQAGANWDEEDQGYYLNLVRDRLLAEGDADRVQIEKAVETIRRFGDECAESGKSSVPVDEAVGYLVARVVDWCRAHPNA